MNRLYLHQIMELNNEAAALIVQKEYDQGTEKLQTGLRQLQAHLAQMPQLSVANSSGTCSNSLDTWMYPAVEALHNEQAGCGPTASFFVYRRPLVVPQLTIGIVMANAESLKAYPNGVAGEHTSLLIAMLFNYGLVCHLSYIDHEGKLNNGRSLLQKASQMYDLAISNLRRLAAFGEAAGSRTIVISSNIQFFRAAMNNLAICEQTRYVLARDESCSLDIPFNKGFERLRELLMQYPSSNDAPEKALWGCYLANILQVMGSFQPNFCAAAC
ncbi:unnamed protein product [Cylindrotheca closterium]|uniref:Uncharacterized protein n=1 Tax=Cylindrotheca closterium TaxID=2856 RepID=A0AAD2FTU5_9STRA|nr:unnamed protein product [Cylindrotheca closterium]